jgi:hypothetical protein
MTAEAGAVAVVAVVVLPELHAASAVTARAALAAANFSPS